VLAAWPADEPLHRPRFALFPHSKAGEIDRGSPTQVGRALAQLGVEHIGAFSPQARGRSERAFQTLQDRLVKELKLARRHRTSRAANAFIQDIYLPAHNVRFAVQAAGEGSAFTPIPGVDLDEILCVQEERQVGQRQLRLLPDAQAADPRKPDAAPFRQGAGQGPRLPRRLPRRVPRTPLHRPLRPERNDQRCEKRRLNPLGGETLWDGMDKPPACPHPPTEAEQKQEEADTDGAAQNRTTSFAIDRN